MSNLKKPNNDDYPDAAGKHLADATVLLAGARHDGAAYLAGYVVECALKTLLQVQGIQGWGHSLNDLTQRVSQACTIAGAATNGYVTATVLALPSAPIASWCETMRYQSSSIARTDAQAWLEDARAVYQDTIARMVLDGVIS